MRQDIKRKLVTDMGFPDNIVSEILADIFGNKDGLTFFEGLVDSVGTRGRAKIISRDSAQYIGTIIHTYDMC